MVFFGREIFRELVANSIHHHHHIYFQQQQTITMSIITNSCTVGGLPEKLIAHRLAAQKPQGDLSEAPPRGLPRPSPPSHPPS